jgi:hypothetical protein
MGRKQMCAPYKFQNVKQLDCVAERSAQHREEGNIRLRGRAQHRDEVNTEMEWIMWAGFNWIQWQDLVDMAISIYIT